MSVELEPVIRGMLDRLPPEWDDTPLTSTITSGLNSAMIFYAGGVMTGGEDTASAWLATDGLTASLIEARNANRIRVVGDLLQAAFALQTEQGNVAAKTARIALEADPAALGRYLCAIDGLFALGPEDYLTGLRALQRTIAVPTDQEARSTLTSLLHKVLDTEREDRTPPSSYVFQQNLFDRLIWLSTKAEEEGLDKSSPRHVTTRIVLVLLHVVKDYLEHPPSPETQ